MADRNPEGVFAQTSRRNVFASLCRAAALVPFYQNIARAQSDPVAAATAALIDGASEAARRKRPFILPRGVTTLYRILLPEGAHLIGAKGGSVLRLGYPGPMVQNSGPLDSLTFEDVTFDGADLPINDAFGLLTFAEVAHFAMDNCTIRHSTTGLLQRRCGGRIRLSNFHDLTGTAILDEDCAGVTIDANKIYRCGANGVHHWGPNSQRHDGSRISNNVIADIKNGPGGEGLYGNGVRVAQCGPVTIDNNVVERCAYTAVRNTGGRDVVVTDNRCKSFGEKAMYAEFGFRNATFKNNVIEDCGAGISATNYVGPGDGDGALIEGNVVTNIHPTHPDSDFGPRMNWLSGCEGEGDVRMVGNTVVGSPWVGIFAGFFGARQNVTVEANRLIDNEYAVGFASQGDVGPCAIIGNEMRGSKKANIVAMFQTDVISGDLALPGAGNTYKNVVLRDNRIL